MKNLKSVWSVGAIASLTCLIATGTWAELDQLGPSSWGALAGLYLVSWCALAHAEGSRLAIHPWRWPAWSEVALLVPLAYVMIRSWHDDFPFSGDHDHHLLAVDAARTFWRSQWIVGILALGLVALGTRFTARAPWPLAVLLLLVVASHKARIPAAYFARYPATLYTLAAAAVSWVEPTGLASAFNVVRLVNALAPVFYLFVLRPKLFPRRESPAWMIPVVFLLFQPVALHFIDSVYLEPWPLVLLLVALEALADETASVALAPLVAGLATAFKETAALPFLCVGAASLWRARHTRADVRTVLGAGTIAVTPFLLYYAVRREEGVWRTLGFAPAGEVFTSDRLAIFRFRLVEQFGWTGLVALGLICTFAVAAAAKRRPIEALVLLAGGLFQIPLFFADRISLPWPGYPRFYLMAWLMMLAPVHWLGRRHARIGVAVLMLGLAPNLARYLASFGGPSYERNFTEDYAAPIYTPVREVVDRADLKTGQVIRIIHGTPFEHDVAFGLIYPDLVERFAWESARAPTADHQCRCAPGVGLLVSTPQSRNLHARSPAAPYPADLDRVTDSCRAEMARTCRCVAAGDPAEAEVCVAR